MLVQQPCPEVVPVLADRGMPTDDELTKVRCAEPNLVGISDLDSWAFRFSEAPHLGEVLRRSR